MAVIIDFGKMKETFQIRKDLDTDYTAMVQSRVDRLAEANKETYNPLYHAFGEAYLATMKTINPIQTSCLTFGYAHVKVDEEVGNLIDKNYHGMVVSNSALSTLGFEESDDVNHRIFELHYFEDPTVPNNDEVIDVQTARQQFYDYTMLWTETNHAAGMALIYELIKSLVDRGFHPRPISWKEENGVVSPASMYFQTKDPIPGKPAYGYVLISVDFDKVWHIGDKIDHYFKENPAGSDEE